MTVSQVDGDVLGHRLRHLRRARGLTLAQLGERVGKPPSYLSMVENGRREPKLSVLADVATALEVPVSDLLDAEPPTRRARLEIAVERAQQDPVYASLGLPHLKPSARVPTDVLEHVVGLYEALKRRAAPQAATPEEARRANATLRAEMREHDNYFPGIEAVAAEALAAVGHDGRGALSQRTLRDLAAHFGFAFERVSDLPTSVRSLADLRHGRIFIPQRGELGGEDARSVVLQTLGHFALDHTDPADFSEFLRQRVEANYFAGAVLLPEAAAVPFLRGAKQDHELSVEDLREVFYVSYEMAAHRFTNLATRHLGMAVHFVRSDEEGVIWKAYENDGVGFPSDARGAIEGQRLCREWGTRRAFVTGDRHAIHHQYTDTPAGMYWCATYVEPGRTPEHAITVGVPFGDARWFRGRTTTVRSASRCPEGPCCKRPPVDLAARWDGFAWPCARAHSHVLAALPSGRFPGVDVTDVYRFLDDHARTDDGADDEGGERGERVEPGVTG